MMIRSRLATAAAAALLLLGATRAAPATAATEEDEARQVLSLPQGETNVPARLVHVTARAVVNFGDLARQQAEQRAAGALPPLRTLVRNELEEPGEPFGAPSF